MFSAMMYQLFARRMTSTSLDVPEEKPAPVHDERSVVPRRIHHQSGPSNISWVSTRSDGEPAHPTSPLGRSASTPSLFLTSSSRPPRLGTLQISTSSPELSLTPVTPEEAKSRMDDLAACQAGPSSHRSPTHTIQITSFPRSRASIDERDPAPSPSSAYSAFIRRPLKRSTSQSSTLTLGPSAPSLPPLALGPSLLHGLPLAPSQPSPLKTQVYNAPFAPSVLPPIPSSPPPAVARSHYRMSDVSEEADALSFVTARSAHGAGRSTTTLLPTSGRENPMRLSLASSSMSSMHEEPVHLPPILSAEAGPSSAADVSSYQRSVSSSLGSVSAPEMTTAVASTTLVASSPLRFTEGEGGSPSVLDLYRLGEAAADAELATQAPARGVSTASTFIDRRWRVGRWSLGDGARLSAALFNARPLSTTLRAAVAGSDACRLLFFAGFFAGPWCWLVGGWLVPVAQPNVKVLRAGLGALSNRAREDLLRTSDPECGYPEKHRMSGSVVWMRRCRFASALGLTAVVLGLVVATVVMACVR